MKESLHNTKKCENKNIVYHYLQEENPSGLLELIEFRANHPELEEGKFNWFWEQMLETDKIRYDVLNDPSWLHEKVLRFDCDKEIIYPDCFLDYTQSKELMTHIMEKHKSLIFAVSKDFCRRGK